MGACRENFVDLFDSQVAFAVIWFAKWNETEQTGALARMLEMVSPIQARFLSIVLEDNLKKCSEIIPQEQVANDPVFLAGLMMEREEDAVDKLLVHLPLLRPDNEEAKQIYMTVIPGVISNCIENCEKIKQARQLLAFVLMHPALKEMKSHFELFKLPLMNTNDGVVKAATVPKPPLTSPYHDSLLTQASCIDQRNQNSIFQSGTRYKEDYSNYRYKQRRYTLSSERDVHPVKRSSFFQTHYASAPVSPATYSDPFKSHDHSQIKDLYPWLKYLRLHKYFPHLSGLKYEELLALNEETFDAKVPGVTQGARKKLLLTIETLNQRCVTLNSLEESVLKNCDTNNIIRVLDEMRTMLFSPLKNASHDERETAKDIPYQFIKVLTTIVNQIPRLNLRHEACIKRLRHLLYLMTKNKAFSTFYAWILSLEKKLPNEDSPRQRQMRPSLSANDSWPRLGNEQLPILPNRSNMIPTPPRITASHQRTLDHGFEASARPNRGSLFNSENEGNNSGANQKFKSSTERNGLTSLISQPCSSTWEGLLQLPIYNTHPRYAASAAASDHPPIDLDDKHINRRLDSLCQEMVNFALSGEADQPIRDYKCFPDDSD